MDQHNALRPRPKAYHALYKSGSDFENDQQATVVDLLLLTLRQQQTDDGHLFMTLGDGECLVAKFRA